MKSQSRVGLKVTGILVASWIGVFVCNTPQPVQSRSVDPVNPPSNSQVQRSPEPEQTQIRLQQELQMRKTVQEEVDRAFNHTTALLNILLGILTVLPIAATVLLYLSRQRAIQELREQMDEQIQKEIENQVQEALKQQTLTIQKQMIELEQESLDVTKQVQDQASKFQSEVNQLKTQFETQLQALKNTATEVEREKARIFREITSITLVSTSKDNVCEEKKRQIETLTERLEDLKSTSSSLDLDVHDFVREGDALFFARRYPEAIDAYDRAINKTIVDTENLFAAWHGKTKSFRRLKQYSKALAASNQAMALKPDDSLMWFERAYLLHIQGHYSEALEIYDRVIAEQPSFYRARNHRGYVLLKLKRYDEAIAELNKSLEIKPDYGNGYYGRAYYYLLRHQLDLAVNDLKRAIEYYPRYKTQVKTDPDFADLWNHADFQTLVNDRAA
jgi:tetratricopeptide (TPR) repeat protein